MEYVTYKSPAGNREHLNFRQTKASFAQPNLISLMRQNSTIKVLRKGNKVYGKSKMAAFDRRHKLIQPWNLTNLITFKLN